MAANKENLSQASEYYWELLEDYYVRLKKVINPLWIDTFERIFNRYREMIIVNTESSAVYQKDLMMQDPEDFDNFFHLAMEIEERLIQTNLPLYKHKYQIVNASIYKSLLIVQGDTGCGKSTQIPQYFFTNPWYYGYSVYVTEPRKFAADCLSSKVCSDLEGLVNVHSCSNHADLSKVSSGSLVYIKETFFLSLLLEEAQKEVPFQGVRAIVLDEIHEFSIEVEVILALLVFDIKEKRSDLSIIIASATLEQEELIDYLGRDYCASLQCNWKPYTVETSYLKECNNYTYDVIKTIERLVTNSSPKTILVFLTGLSEINFVQSIIKKKFSNLKVLLLHGKMEYREQEKVLSTTNETRVILSTNFAESSITIPNVTHVIDCGREKLTTFNDSKLSETQVVFISQASAIQRKGRAGREGPGYCFRMYSLEDYECMERFRTPKILSSGLGQALLKLQSYGLRPIDLPLLHKPSPEKIKAAYLNLIINNQLNKQLEVTDAGRFSLIIDIDPVLASMIYFSGFKMEIILLACLLKCCDNIYDPKKWLNIPNFLLNPLFIKEGDFLLLLFIARQYSMIKCSKCFNEAYDWKIKDCQDCSHCRKSWARYLMIQEKSLSIAFKYMGDIVKTMTDYKIEFTYMFTEEQTKKEIELAANIHAETPESLINEVLDQYSAISEPFRKIIVNSFFINFSERISEDNYEPGYLRIETKELGVISANSIMIRPCTSYAMPPDFIICFRFAKVNSKLFFKFCTYAMISDDNDRLTSWLKQKKYEKNSGDYNVVAFQNIGKAYFTELHAHGGEKLAKIEQKFTDRGIYVIFHLNKYIKAIQITVHKANELEVRRIMESELKEIRQCLKDRSKLHISMNQSYCAILSLGCKIKEIINLRDEIKYKISNLDPSLSNSDITKELKNTFEFNFASIERATDSILVFVYFVSKEQAYSACKSLKIKPLKGRYNFIDSMESLCDSSKRGKKLKVSIPLSLSSEDLASVFSSYNEMEIHRVNNRMGNTEMIASFKSFERAEYFASNFRVLIRDRFGISASSATVLSDGIHVPKDLLRHAKVKEYIEDIKNDCNCYIDLNKSYSRIYCDFDSIPEAAKDRILLLIKNDTVESPFLIWREIYRKTHYHKGKVLSWQEWQISAEVSCVYHSYRKLIVIYGLPYKRSEALNYLRSQVHSISSQIVSETISYDTRKYGPHFWKEALVVYDELELNLDQKYGKVHVKGIKETVDQFLLTFQGYTKKELEKKYECNFCYENMMNCSVELSLCGHILHKTCFVKYLESKLSDFSKSVPIRCIYCQEKVTYDDLFSICSLELLQNIEKASVNCFMDIGLGKKKYSWCENLECSHIYEISSTLSNGKILRYCPECKLRLCTKCSRPAYGNHDVECEREWQKIHAQANHEWIIMNTVQCPLCEMSYEKSGGCNHMTCTRCENHFCFICRKIIMNKNVLDHYQDPETVCYRKYINA